MPIPSGDSAAVKLGQIRFTLWLFLAEPQFQHSCCLAAPIPSHPPARAQGCVPAVSLAPPAGPKGHSQAATTTAAAATGTGTTALGEGYGNSDLPYPPEDEAVPTPGCLQRTAHL